MLVILMPNHNTPFFYACLNCSRKVLRHQSCRRGLVR
nr:MAG TPA: hypothetical protein [Caudoviricetes sp.]